MNERWTGRDNNKNECAKKYIKIVLSGNVHQLLEDANYENNITKCFGRDIPMTQIRKFFDILAYIKEKVDKSGYDSSIKKELFQMLVIVKNSVGKNKARESLFRFVEKIVKEIFSSNNNEEIKKLIDSFYLFMEFYVAILKSKSKS